MNNRFEDRYNKIARTFTSEFTEAKNGRNIVLSPASVIMLLGIAADASQGRARDA